MNKDLVNKYLSVFLSLFIIMFLLSGCSFGEHVYTEQAFSLDTFISVTYYREKDRQAVLDSLELCRKYEKIFSCTDSESELYKLNESDFAEVSEELLTVLRTALDFCEKSGGKFDITMGGVSRLYGFSEIDPCVPADTELENALSHTGWELINIDGSFVSIKDPETVIDLGAIAKGFIADKMKEMLVDRGVQHAIISLGGNILTVGGKPDGSDFRIGIRNPESGSEKLISTVAGSDISVVTSGIYERFFEKDGKLYHHILDPETGAPVENGLLSVSVTGYKSMLCDALSTVCFALGTEEGASLVEEMEGYEALFVTKEKELIMTSGYEKITVK